MPLLDRPSAPVSRRAVVATGARLAYATPLVTASLALAASDAGAQALSPVGATAACTHGYWKHTLRTCGGGAWPVDPGTAFDATRTLGAAIGAEPDCVAFQGAAARLNAAAFGGGFGPSAARVRDLIARGDCAALAAANEAAPCPLANTCAAPTSEKAKQ